MAPPRVSKKRPVVRPNSQSEQADDEVIRLSQEQGASAVSRRKRAAPPSPTHAVTSPSRKKNTRASRTNETAKPRPGQTLHSFFNAATQRQQDISQQSESFRIEAEVVDDELDAIEEIDGATIDDASATNGSITQTTSRKRKLGIDNLLLKGSGAGQQSVASTRFIKPASDLASAQDRSLQDHRRPWTDQFPPAELTELAVHKKKVAQVRSLLEEAVSSRARPRLIVLKGPAGTGKTTTIKLLAKELGLVIREWENPGSNDSNSSSSVSASSKFEDFLLRGAQFATLDFDENEPQIEQTIETRSQDNVSRIVLVEEFPSTASGAVGSANLQAFRATVQQYLALHYSSPGPFCNPIVMVISETLLANSSSAAEGFTAHRVLGPAILTHPMTALVEFNNVASTILVKALELIAVKEARRSGRRRTPGPAVLKQLAEVGDIRSAVSSFEFMCLRGDAGDDVWSAKIAFTKPKRAVNKDAPLTKYESEALAVLGHRQGTIGIFHAVGKVVYNKRQPVVVHDTEFDMGALYRWGKMPETEPEPLLRELGTEIPTFIAALHENYALSCSSTSSEATLDSLNACLDALSDADLIAPDRFGIDSRTSGGSTQDMQRQADMAFHTAVRGLLYGLPYPVKRETSGQGSRNDAFQMFYPASARLWSKQQAMVDTLDLVLATISAGGPTSEDNGAVRGSVITKWKSSHTAVPTSDIPNEALSTDNQSLSSAARIESLLERLPYMTRILASTQQMDDHIPAQTALSRKEQLLHNLQSLTTFSGNGQHASAEEDDEEVLESVMSPGRSSRDLAKVSATNLQGHNKSSKIETEGGGLRIPVEHDIDRLVLSDDDIVD